MIVWRRTDHPGHESCRIVRHDSTSDRSWRLEGSASLVYEGQPCRVDYEVVCDDAWRTKSAAVRGWIGERAIDITISVADGRWSMNGVAQPQVAGCVDVDLNFSPSTNTLPIRRLSLEVGQQADVAAAWLRFPGFTLERLEQTYTRTCDRTWRYSSAGGSFVADLEVDADGLVLKYGPWEAENRRPD